MFNCKYGCISTCRLGCCLYYFNVDVKLSLCMLSMFGIYSPCVCWVCLVYYIIITGCYPLWDLYCMYGMFGMYWTQCLGWKVSAINIRCWEYSWLCAMNFAWRFPYWDGISLEVSALRWNLPGDICIEVYLAKVLRYILWGIFASICVVRNFCKHFCKHCVVVLCEVVR